VAITRRLTRFRKELAAMGVERESSFARSAACGAPTAFAQPVRMAASQVASRPVTAAAASTGSVEPSASARGSKAVRPLDTAPRETVRPPAAYAPVMEDLEPAYADAEIALIAA
jgi:hypothetical protein